MIDGVDSQTGYVNLQGVAYRRAAEIDPAQEDANEMDREVSSGTRRSWREVDRQLRGLVQRRCELDANEAACLREVEELRVWRDAGYVSILDYLERVAGYSPRTAKDRLRVARRLGELPRLSDALARGEHPHSSVRELVRVVTPATEAAWLAAAEGMGVHEIEALVAGHRQGDLPEDPADPELRVRTITLELSPETFAMYREVQRLLASERGEQLEDDALMAEMCRRILAGGGDGDVAAKRPAYQISVTTCRACKRGWQAGGGRAIEIGQEAIEMASCDAEHGSLDGDDGIDHEAKSIPRATRKLVWTRDRGACVVPGCRSTRGLDVHHIVHQERGGGHEPSNLAVICKADHRNSHRGRLAIAGTAPDHLTFTWNRPSSGQPRTASSTPAPAAPLPSAIRGPHSAPAPLAAATHAPSPRDQAVNVRATTAAGCEAAALERDACRVLVASGYSSGVARSAVHDALGYVAQPGLTLEALLPEAFRRARR